MHLLGDAERVLVACATPAAGLPTVDAAGYFRTWTASPDRSRDARAARFTRIVASAYRLPGLRAHWADLSGAAVRAVGALDPSACVATQGHVLSVHELARTLVTEATVHHLDVLVEVSGPPPAGLQVSLQVFSDLPAGVLGARGPPLPGDAERWLLLSGRLPLTSADRVVLGAAADRFPLLS